VGRESGDVCVGKESGDACVGRESGDVCVGRESGDVCVGKESGDAFQMIWRAEERKKQEQQLPEATPWGRYAAQRYRHTWSKRVKTHDKCSVVESA
jgi:hypothetical protein